MRHVAIHDSELGSKHKKKTKKLGIVAMAGLTQQRRAVAGCYRLEESLAVQCNGLHLTAATELPAQRTAGQLQQRVKERESAAQIITSSNYCLATHVRTRKGTLISAHWQHYAVLAQLPIDFRDFQALTVLDAAWYSLEVALRKR